MKKKDYILPQIKVLELSSLKSVANDVSVIVNNTVHDFGEHVDEEFF